MGLTPEGKVKKHLRDKVLDPNNWPYNTVTTRGHGRSGHPDFTVNAGGIYILIETKVDKPEPTSLQHNELVRHAQAGALGFVLARTGLRMYRPTTPGCYEDKTVAATDLTQAANMLEAMIKAWVYTMRSGAMARAL